MLELHTQWKDREPLSIKDAVSKAAGSLIDGIDDGCNVEDEDSDDVDDVGIEKGCKNAFEV